MKRQLIRDLYPSWYDNYEPLSRTFACCLRDISQKYNHRAVDIECVRNHFINLDRQMETLDDISNQHSDPDESKSPYSIFSQVIYILFQWQMIQTELTGVKWILATPSDTNKALKQVLHTLLHIHHIFAGSIAVPEDWKP